MTLHPWHIVTAIVVPVAGWAGKQYFRIIGQRYKKLDARVSILETTVATRADCQRLDDRLERLAADMNRGQREILETMLSSLYSAGHPRPPAPPGG